VCFFIDRGGERISDCHTMLQKYRWLLFDYENGEATSLNSLSIYAHLHTYHAAMSDSNLNCLFHSSLRNNSIYCAPTSICTYLSSNVCTYIITAPCTLPILDNIPYPGNPIPTWASSKLWLRCYHNLIVHTALLDPLTWLAISRRINKLMVLWCTWGKGD